jgi:hypothetical protein
MMPPEIQARIDQIYANIKPLQEYYGIQSKTIEQRYEEYLKKQQEKEKALAALAAMPKPRFKLPKL